MTPTSSQEHLARCQLFRLAERVGIVFVADACTDQTAKVARQTVGAFGEVLEVTARSLRTARRIGESALLEHFRHQPQLDLLLASTHADTHVPRDWIDSLRDREIRGIGSPTIF